MPNSWHDAFASMLSVLVQSTRRSTASWAAFSNTGIPGGSRSASCRGGRGVYVELRTFIFGFQAIHWLNRLECIGWGRGAMERAMQTTVQTMPKNRSALQKTKSHPVTPDALDLLEQFGITVTVQRGHEIYGQSEPTEFCWRIVSGCARTEKYSGGWASASRRIPLVGRSGRHG